MPTGMKSGRSLSTEMLQWKLVRLAESADRKANEMNMVSQTVQYLYRRYQAEDKGEA